MYDSSTNRTAIAPSLSTFLEETFGVRPIHLSDVQQGNVGDCGVYAIANGVMAALGYDVRRVAYEDVEYTPPDEAFDPHLPPTSMRRQVWTQLSSGYLSPFRHQVRLPAPDFVL